MTAYKITLALMCLACCSAILFNWPKIDPADISVAMMTIVIISCTMAIIKAIEQGKKM